MFAIDLSSVFLFEDSKRIKISHESLVEKEKDECEKIIDEMQAIVNKLDIFIENLKIEEELEKNKTKNQNM